MIVVFVFDGLRVLEHDQSAVHPTRTYVASCPWLGLKLVLIFGVQRASLAAASGSVACTRAGKELSRKTFGWGSPGHEMQMKRY